MGDFSSHFEHKAHRNALLKVAKKVKCAECGLYGCICQSNLIEFGAEVVKPLVEVTYAQKVANCPHRCVNSGKCLDCFDFDKFKGVVRL